MKQSGFTFLELTIYVMLSALLWYCWCSLTTRLPIIIRSIDKKAVLINQTTVVHDWLVRDLLTSSTMVVTTEPGCLWWQTEQGLRGWVLEHGVLYRKMGTNPWPKKVPVLRLVKQFVSTREHTSGQMPLMRTILLVGQEGWLFRSERVTRRRNGGCYA